MLHDRDALIVQHLSLVPPIAQRVKESLPPSFELDDLIGEGYLGLMQAAARYRPEENNGTPFSAFARLRIRGAMVDSVRRKAWVEGNASPIEAAPEATELPKMTLCISTRHHANPEARRGGRAPLRRSRLPQRIGTALRRLTARQRAILGAFYADPDPTLAEVARDLGLTPELVEAEFRSAFGQLRMAARNVSVIGSTLDYFCHPELLTAGERAA